MSIDAMKQALEALEMLAKWEHPASNITTKSGRIYPHHVAKNSAATLRLAIEQAEKQEPVLWEPKIETLYQDGFVVSQRIKRTPDGPWEEYTSPPQRQPLTDEEIDQGLLRTSYALQSAAAWRDGVRFAERKHGIGGEA